MKIQCNVCEAAEANVLCCADEAALCWACDEKVHAANKLASKHQRVPLSKSSSQMPICDICQEAIGYFFCLEDRALLCRKCDVSIHTTNSYVSAHQRFLLTGVKVSTEPAEPGPLSIEKSQSDEVKSFETRTRNLSNGNAPKSLPSHCSNGLTSCVHSGVGETMPLPMPSRAAFFGGSTTGSVSQWQLDDFLGFTDFDHTYGFSDHGSSKADSAKLSDSDCSPIMRVELELDMDEILGQGPESSVLVPEISSPPTSSGLYWPRRALNAVVFVPELSFSPSDGCQQYRPASKRKRHF